MSLPDSLPELPPLPPRDHAFADLEGEQPDIELWRSKSVQAYARTYALQAIAAEREKFHWWLSVGTLHLHGNDERGWSVSDSANGLIFRSRHCKTRDEAIDKARAAIDIARSQEGTNG